MSILTIVRNVCIETGWADPPTVVIASTNKAVMQLRILAEKALRQCRREYLFREFTREHTFTLVAAQSNYALPGDFDAELFDTHWNQSDNWRIWGPLTPSEWREQQDASVATGISQYYTLRGRASRQYYIDPAPGTGDAGKTCVFEYISRTTIRPADHTSGASYSAGDYCWYDGVIYKTTSGGTASGATPLVDVGVTDWTAYTSTYDAFVADSDMPLLEEDIVEIGVKALFKMGKRLDGYVEDISAWDETIRMAAARSMGSRNVNLDGRTNRRWPNIAQTGFSNYGA